VFEVFAKIPDLEIIVPDESLTDRGFVRNDAEADKVIRFFRKQEIQGLLIGAMTFGDEVAALAVAQAFREKPVFLFGTKEAEITPEGLRSSDSFCGTLSISSGLHRRENSLHLRRHRLSRRKEISAVRPGLHGHLLGS